MAKRPIFEESDYYSLHDIMSYNAMWSFVIGGRGDGKTYDALRFCIKKFINLKRQFVYIRRYDTEIKKVRPKFFKDMAHVFPKFAFRIEGDTLQICRNPTADKKERTWEDMGYLIALNTAGNVKSIAFPDVYYAIYDEIFPNIGTTKYLPQEAITLQELYSTLDRARDQVRLIALSNANSLANPYFSQYNLPVELQKKPIQLYHNGFIAVELVDSTKYANKVKQTRWGQFIDGTEYAEYAIENKFRDDTSNMIRDLDRTNDLYNYTLETELGDIRIWSHQDLESFESFYTLSSRHPKTERWRTTIAQNVDKDKPLLSHNDEILKRLNQAYKYGRLYFDSRSIKATYLNLWGNLI